MKLSASIVPFTTTTAWLEILLVKTSFARTEFLLGRKWEKIENFIVSLYKRYKLHLHWSVRCFCFCKIQLPCLVYDTLPPGCYGSVFISIASTWIHTQFFFFVFVFQFYIIHPVRSRVLYHSFSVNFDCYPFFLFPFSFFLFFFFFYFHLSVKCTGGARAEEKRCCVFWAVLAGCYNGRLKFSFSFSSRFLLKADWKKWKGRKA